MAKVTYKTPVGSPHFDPYKFGEGAPFSGRELWDAGLQNRTESGWMGPWSFDQMYDMNERWRDSQTAAPKPAPAAPEPVSEPQGLNLDPNMTPFQRRAAIATGGVGQQNAIYRDPGVQKYYNSLLGSAFGGSNFNFDNDILPIEHQYMRDVLGYNYDGMDTLRSLLLG